MIGELERDWGPVVRYEGGCPSLIISPGAGTPGSLSCRFMRTVDRRLPACEDCRFLLTEPPEEPEARSASKSCKREIYLRLESSCCRPAFTAAAAWREVDADRERGEGLWPRRAAPSPEFDTARAIDGDPDIDRDGGREFKSGAIVFWFYGRGQGEGFRKADRYSAGHSSTDAKMTQAAGRREVGLKEVGR